MWAAIKRPGTTTGYDFNCIKVYTDLLKIFEYVYL